MTHDSIGLGEDGPTHQPVEQVASLRAMPNLLVFRPADAIETAECWKLAIENRTGPSVMALSRQKVPPVRKDAGHLAARGAYEIAAASGPAGATIFSAGTEVSVAIAARDTLEAEGIATRVVSAPCWELFEAQDEAYKKSVLGDAPVRVAVEAGVRMGWDRFVGADGGFVGMEGFGASAPYERLYKEFGITAEAVVEAVKARL
jgi:transketolase